MEKNLRKILYTPSGRAGAYAKGGYALNIFKGCNHGCTYCYVPAFCHLDRSQFHDDVYPAPNVLERLDRDLKRLGLIEEPIFMCFTCDPYPIDPALRRLTTDVIKMILKSGNAVNILTKGGTRAEQDFDLLASNPRNRLGATLTFFEPALSLKWEPGAEIPQSRIRMLERAKKAGIQTWASIEPVIIPSQSLGIMELSREVVDEFKVGKWNHDKRADSIDWRRFYHDVVKLGEACEKTFTFKQDLIDAARTCK